MSLHISPEYARRSLSCEAEYASKFVKYATLEEPAWTQVVRDRKGEPMRAGPSAELIFCSLCGMGNHLTGKFCSACGTQLGSTAASMDKRIVWLSSIAMTLVFIMGIALYSNESTHQAWGTFLVLSVVAAAIALCFVVWRRILTQAGYPTWLSVIAVVPGLLGLVILYMAFAEWPIAKKLKTVEAECVKLRRTLAAREAGEVVATCL